MTSRTRRQVVAVLVFLLVVVFFTTTFRMAVVRGDSMLPTYQDGQIVLVNRLSALGGPLRKGDVVLVNKGRDVLIKRIAFLPGDILGPRDIWRFRRVQEKFERLPAPANADPFMAFRLQVPKDRVVILGDNPAVSDDSRAFGPVPLSDILGRVVSAPPKP